MSGTTLAQALVAAQNEMPVVPKAAKANYGKYATLDSIIEKTRPVLNKYGLAISQFPSETSTGGPGLRTVLLHAESGEQLEATVPLLLNGKNDMQALGGAITYARRYGWAAVLGIANDEDDDGNRASAPAPKAAAPRPAVAPPAAAAPSPVAVAAEAAANVQQQKKLDRLIANLTTADPSIDWPEAAEKYSQREFKKTRMQLDRGQIDQLVGAMTKKYDELTAKAAA